MKNEITKQNQKNDALKSLALKLEADPEELKNTLKTTAFKDCKTDHEFLAAMMTANKYSLNPILKEIYAFPGKAGGVIPVVSIDGWISLVQRQQKYDGVELIENKDNNGNVISITSKFFIKDQSHPVTITEYMSECRDESKYPWKKWPIRMLRHKAYIQGARVAFGLSGIYDPDEAERLNESEIINNIEEISKPKTEKPRKMSEKDKVDKEEDIKEAEIIQDNGEISNTTTKVSPQISPLDQMITASIHSEIKSVISKVLKIDERTIKNGKIKTGYTIENGLIIAKFGRNIEGAKIGDTLEFKNVLITEYPIGSGIRQFLASKIEYVGKDREVIF